jgi:predicted secreted protein with PEFG-CTERM motif
MLVISFSMTQAVFAEEMKGNNISMSIAPSPFNSSTDKQVTLVFTPNPNQQELSVIEPKNKVEHLDYVIVITKDGHEVFNKQFHTHSGVLTLVFTPSQDIVNVTGGESDPNNTTTGPYDVSGSIVSENGNYQISASIVGVEFNPLPSPVEDKFTMQVVPEFGPMATLILISAITGTIVLYKMKFRL